jgi:hypothetical protein
MSVFRVVTPCDTTISEDHAASNFTLKNKMEGEEGGSMVLRNVGIYLHGVIIQKPDPW